MLTGDWDAVYDVITGFKVATRPPRPAADAPAPGGTEITHSTAVSCWSILSYRCVPISTE